MDEYILRNKIKDFEMLIKLLDVIINKKISDEDYKVLLEHFTEKEEYEYCERLKKIKEREHTN